MKKVTLLIIAACVFLGVSAQGVGNGKKVMKVSYVGTTLSPGIVAMLKKNIPSPEMYKQTVSLLEKHEYFYSLYVDLGNMESVYVLDSIHSQPGVSAFGQVNSVYTDKDGNFRGTEDFIGSKSGFEGNVMDLKWNVTGEEKEIAGYRCTKMQAEGYKDMEIWTCTDIAVGRGPGYFQNPLGLVFEASDFFGTTTVKRIEYMDSADAIEKGRQELLSGKFITLKEELSLKDNVIRTMRVDNGQ